MKTLFLILPVILFLSGCATKMAYLNTQKPAEEVKVDKTACQSVVDKSDFKDSGLREKKFNECMKDKGYKVVSEEQAEKIQGFKELWIKPGADFKAYEAIFIDKVDLSQVKLEEAKIPDTKASDEDINKLGEEMFRRYSKSVGLVIPVVTEKEELSGKKALYLTLRLINISQTNIGLSAALEVAGEFAPVPLPDAPEGTFSFEGEISDFASREKLVTISDAVKADKNGSFLGTEKFTHWQKGYNVIDYWADHLAELIAKQRGQEYKSQLGMKII